MPHTIPKVINPTAAPMQNAPIDVIIINDPINILALVARVTRLRTLLTAYT